MTTIYKDQNNKTTNYLEIALTYHNAGLRLIPVNDKKIPVCKAWKHYQKGQSQQDIYELFEKPCWGIAVLTGNGIEALDVDSKHWVYESDLLIDLMKHSDVKNKKDCPFSIPIIQSTKNKGYHLIYKCDIVGKNEKLAMNNEGEVILETRGEGGYIVSHPSPGYEMQKGSFYELPTLNIKQRELLLKSARDFDENEIPRVNQIPGPSNKSFEGKPPWEAYEENNHVLEILQSYGWEIVKEQGQKTFLKRPGGSSEYSGNYHSGHNVFVCFSTSTEFEPGKGYSAFGVYAVLEHNGDFSAAAKELYKKGYGDRQKSKRKPKNKQKAILVNKVLSSLLEEISELNFREKLDLDDDEKPKQKHCIVAIVDEVISIAEQKKWGLCVQNDFIYVYNGQYWQVADKAEFRAFLGEAADKMKYNYLDSRHYEFREKLFKQFIGIANLPAPKEDEYKTLINLQNGTLEITPMGVKLREFIRNDFLKYQLTFEYSPNAECPRFRKFLDRVLPHESSQKVLSEFIGYVFIRHLKLEKCLVLHGSGANGKSVFFDVVNALLGENNITNYSLGNLMEEHNRANITNALLNYGSEIKGNLESDDFKLLASGEKIQARLKYGNSFIMQDYAKLAFNCNELPADVEHTEAFFRRFLIIGFNVTIPPEERNPYLAREIIENELPGVLNWVLEGLNGLLTNNKFSSCPIIDESLNRYRRNSDSVSLFIDEFNYVPDIEEKTPQRDLYREYKEFCKDDNYRPVSNRKFGPRLEQLGFERNKTNIGQVLYLKQEK